MDMLRFGSVGPQVELLQATLSRVGFLDDAPDGIFGVRTRDAVTAFQRSMGLAADGVVGPITWQALRPFMVGYRFHIVQPGDTFFSLARRYDTSVQAIETANPDVVPTRLTLGTRLVIPLAFPVVYTNISFTYTVLELCIEGLRARYPFINVGEIGRSVAGRTLYYLSLGNGSKTVMYNASHHANEWITTPVLMRFAEEYARSYSRGGQIWDHDAAALFADTTVFIVPMVNPDGVSLVTGEIEPGSAPYEALEALNTHGLPFPDGWKANFHGVDLNLNYPAEWETARDIKFAQGFTTPGPRDYVGPEPLSEPESRALAAFTRSHRFALTLSYHTQGNVIFWQFLDYLPPRSLEIAQAFAAASGYTVAATPYGSGFAGFKDWFIQAFDLPGFTIEAGLGVNPLPIEQFEQIYRDNLGILVLGASMA